MLDLKTLDRIKRLAVIAMVSDDDLMNALVLKGGNALDLIYGVSDRSSIDIDFSMESEFPAADLDRIRGRIEHFIRAIFREAGYEAFDISLAERPAAVTPDLASFWGGYVVEFKLIPLERRDEAGKSLQALRRRSMVVGPRERRKFRVEISKHEYCGAKTMVEIEGYALFVYAPIAILFEKLRAICQQLDEYRAMVKSHLASRTRDYFDIHALNERFRFDLEYRENLEALRSIFAAKKVPLRLLSQIGRGHHNHESGYARLQESILPIATLHPFEFYRDYVDRIAERLLKALGDV
jgi:predicted nucleotidyltransferase component of viral defense system